MAYCGLHASEGEAERSLETAKVKALSLGGSVVTIPTKSLIHPIQSIGAIAIIHSKTSNIPFGYAPPPHYLCQSRIFVFK